MSSDELSLDLFQQTSEPEVWTVSQVNRAARLALEGGFRNLWVSGEVGSWTRAGSGHCYFTLKDRTAQLRCVMWRTEAARLPMDPDEGMEVRVQGGLTVYEARGEYQLQVRRLEAAGEEGLWRLAFEKLRTRLDAEGLLAPERKRPIPRFPKAVGVVTSASGAALRDILTVIRRRAPWTRVVLRSARVQGEGAAVEVANALRALDRSGLVDVVIVGRGGGSIEDLWAFNEEPVARAVAESSVPVISAVGHEVDVTISDLVADLRAPTPSAAAEAVVQDGRVLLDGLRVLPARLTRALRSAVERRRDLVARGRRRLEQGVALILEPRRRVVAEGTERLARGIMVLMEARRRRLAAFVDKLEALSPLATLRRGYAVALAEDGRVLRGVRQFREGAPFVLRVADGRVDCQTLATHSDSEDSGE
ncbi:MAG TPA: exodeoxyribonuclease VII large subunit [Longimicrobiales bacterium]